ncbi:major capsid hexamer protein [Mycobacterium phage Godines]|uniref:Major capsid protein n=1 Tax=Mycobacterium phage Godines TaxID=1675551 RepID=A0A0K1LRX5_9CAUD|nr:major head protein [Mycobacterium phage Godines]AKU45214.1 major capsid hexamer protein [Mycobacterium phage Godines]
MFVLPDELPTDIDALQALARQAQAAINVIQARHAAHLAGTGEELTPDDVRELRALVEADEAISAAIAEATPEAVDQAEVDALLARAAAPAANEDNGTPADDAPEDGGSAADVVAEAEAAAAAEAAAGEPALAASGAGAPSANFAAVGTPGAPADAAAGNTERRAGWVMSPDAPGYVAGPVGFREIALGIDSVRPGSRGARRPTGQRGSFSTQRLASLTRDAHLVQDSHDLVAEIERATSQINGGEFRGQAVTASALVAAGGWCAPSEQLYDFCDVPDPTDLISLPEITIRRGGVRWPIEPDVSALLTDFAFQFFFTEQQLEAEDGDGKPTAVKECIEIPCADEFEELRLAAIGYCVEAGILQDQGWPELTEWFLRTFAAAHLRGVSWRTIQDMVAGSGTPKIIPTQALSVGATTSVLNGLALQATNLRLQRGVARNATIEGVAPSWFSEVIRADLAIQEGVDTKAITDGQINSWLAARNIYLQYVADWQSRGAGQPGHLDTVQWPNSVNVLLYPAGTWFRAMQNVIDLGVMYPKEQLQVNRYTRFFTEDSIAVGKRCEHSINVQLPLCVNGAIGERIEVSCNVDPGDNSFTLTNTAESGQYKLKVGGKTTADIAYNADNATIKSALVALDDGYSASDFDVTGTSPKTIKAPKELGSIEVVAGTTPVAGGTVTVTLA